PEGEHVTPLGLARTVREGDDLTFVAYGAMVPVAEQAADLLDASVEILDIRTLKPLDEESLLAAAAKTGRVVVVQEAPRTAGYGAERARPLAGKTVRDVRAEPPSLEQKVQLLRAFRGQFDRGENFVYGLFSEDESEVVGGSGLHPRAADGISFEIGYWIRASAIGQGYATEATAALARVG